MNDAFLVLGIAVLFILFIAAIIVGLILLIRKKGREEGEEELPLSHKKEELKRELAGEEGEKIVSSMCERICKDYDGGLFNSFCFCDSRGYSSEIDHIVITRGGIFVIETKNWSGIIKGNPNEETWMQIKPNRDQQKKVKNPILQNEKHIQHLMHRFQSNPPKRISRVVFSGSVTLDVKNNRLFTTESANQFIRKRTEEAPYSRQYVERVYNQFEDILNHYGITKEEHLKNIQEKNRII